MVAARWLAVILHLCSLFVLYLFVCLFVSSIGRSFVGLLMCGGRGGGYKEGCSDS